MKQVTFKSSEGNRMKIKTQYSVIIPHFDNEDGLRRLLASIPGREDIQVVVVDDKSKASESKGIVERSNLYNAQWFFNSSVKSAGACRNIGLEYAIGQYLIFADSDDYFCEGAFEIIDAAIEADPECDVYYFNVDSTGIDGGVGNRHVKNRSLVLDYISRSGSAFEEKLRLTHNVPWGKVIRRSLVEEKSIKFDQTVVANDGIFSLKVGKAAKRISAHSNVIYCVTSNAYSLTRKKDVSRYRVRLEVYARYFEYLDDEERRKVNASPIPIILLSLNYGLVEFFRSIIFLKKRKVAIFKYFKFRYDRVRLLIR